MIGVPQPSPYDISFRLAGIPIRISPMFWIITFVLGWGDGDFKSVAIWVGCVLFSVIVHEMGHGLTNKIFGRRPAIVLHGMGGLCFSEGPSLSSWKRVLVLFNGPLAGFMIYGIIYLTTQNQPLTDPNVREILNNLIFINLFWGLINLIPIWPLDGGQIMGVILQKISLRRGQELTHGLSLVVSGIGAILVFQRTEDVYLTLLLGMFAFNNFQMLQMMRHNHLLTDDSETEWWKR